MACIEAAITENNKSVINKLNPQKLARLQGYTLQRYNSVAAPVRVTHA